MAAESEKKTILFFGFGYTAQNLFKLMSAQGWKGYASARNLKSKKIKKDDLKYFDFTEDKYQLEKLISSVDAIMISIPPQGTHDPVLESYRAIFQEKSKLSWVGYLSATSVYGDFNSAWVSEETKPIPKTERGKNRFLVEEKWRELGVLFKIPVIRFRIAGIYGPGRSPFDRIREGKQKLIQKRNQVFNRVHIDDLCEILFKSIGKPKLGDVFNISDNSPSSLEDFINEATNLLGLPNLDKTDIKDAQLSEMALSFFVDSKKVSNERVVKKFGYKFKYPSYREGLNHILENEY